MAGQSRPLRGWKKLPAKTITRRLFTMTNGQSPKSCFITAHRPSVRRQVLEAAC